MTNQQMGITPRLARILMSEEAIYGLILVSGMVVVSGLSVGTAVNALVTVVVTVIVFYLAHVYAGTLGRLAATDGRATLRAGLAAAARQSGGMLLASLPPLVVLLLGALGILEENVALWFALIVNTVLLGGLGWFAVARWSTSRLSRIAGAVITAAFGGVLILLKAFISH